MASYEKPLICPWPYSEQVAPEASQAAAGGGTKGGVDLGEGTGKETPGLVIDQIQTTVETSQGGGPFPAADAANGPGNGTGTFHP